jgi:hypothetical protein
MFIDHTILFDCMAWWVRTRVLTTVSTFDSLSLMAPKKVAWDLSHLRTFAQGEYALAPVTAEELEKQLILGNVKQFRYTIRL